MFCARRAVPLFAVILGVIAAAVLSTEAGVTPPLPPPQRAPAASSRVKKFVVLMLENRSWDHYFGISQSSATDRLNGTETSCLDPWKPKHGDCFTVTPNEPDHAKNDPPHDLDSITTQIYGYNKPHSDRAPALMNGFTKSWSDAGIDYKESMKMLTGDVDSGQILNLLAKEFAVADHWFCSIPGPTDPNRAMSMAGTSQGVITNFNGTKWTQQSIFDFLRTHNKTTSAVYQDDLWAIGYFADMHKPENTPSIKHLDDFYSEVKNGELADFTWLQPRMTSHKGMPTWQHPTAGIRDGEALVRDIYQTLRNSKFWEELVFVITYDEHGGFYDHVHPPQDGIPAPDGYRDKTGFPFDRLGVRIPTIVISPWIDRGTVIHKPYPGAKPAPTSQFDGTSVIATASKLLGLYGPISQGALGKRASWAATFEPVLEMRDSPRTDCPTELPHVRPSDPEELATLRQSAPDDHLVSQLIFYCLHGVERRSEKYCKSRHLERFTTHYAASGWVEDQAERMVKAFRAVEQATRQ